MSNTDKPRLAPFIGVFGFFFFFFCKFILLRMVFCFMLLRIYLYFYLPYFLNKINKIK